VNFKKIPIEFARKHAKAISYSVIISILFIIIYIISPPPYMPASPYPDNNSVGIGTQISLSWEGGTPKSFGLFLISLIKNNPQTPQVTYNIYLGDNIENLTYIDKIEKLGGGNKERIIYNPSNLKTDTAYYWRIIAINELSKETEGPVWKFVTTRRVINDRPDTPSMPIGLASGYTETTYSYNASASDPNGDQVKYIFDWGDGNTSETPFVNSGKIASASHTWSSAGTYLVKTQAIDNKSASSNWSNTLKIIINAKPPHPPSTPSIPSGTSIGSVNTSYSYSTSAIDPGGDQVKYTFNWGDGKTSETDFVDSGISGTSSHTWINEGTYYVKARATNIKGASSEKWSSSSTVIIKKGEPPTIESFASDKYEISKGNSATLRWSVRNADKIVLQPQGTEVSGVGSEIVSPSETIAYTLTASNNAGKTGATVIIKTINGLRSYIDEIYTINPRPGQNSSRPETGQQVALKGHGDSNIPVRTYQWESDKDGILYSGIVPSCSISFSSPGDHVIKFTVIDEHGDSSSASRKITVSEVR
jgi:hypothetical protein